MSTISTTSIQDGNPGTAAPEADLADLEVLI
jgi:hypothetical protein